MTSVGRVVYLTFDDGPTRGYTDEILADLNAAGAHATFFQLGRNMPGNERLMQWMVRDGEQLGTHSWDQPPVRRLTPARTAWEIGAARALQVRDTGLDSRLFRYPYDQPTDAAAVYLGQQRMLSIDAGINVPDWDWPRVTDAQVIAAVMAPGVPRRGHPAARRAKRAWAATTGTLATCPACSRRSSSRGTRWPACRASPARTGD
jgi:peptidoglycan/xylan/chitin deacetylase (PgdA/CDA1 family)